MVSFFHQDWRLDASTEADAVAGQFVEELEPQAVLLVRRDAQLLHERLPAERITTLWNGCVESGERFFRNSRLADGAEWMRQVIAVCDEWILRHPHTVTLSEADQYEGRELDGRVRSAIAEFEDWFDRGMVQALIECVELCTPDLAFRLLLQALPRASAASSPDYLELSKQQYARLASLGREFRYGAYVVSDVEYLARA
ncbi:hypothetical protein FKN01_12620 [Streptomyces sp. 130]|uniref:hypothetical protein n=1 Tax=Streptomyces sp. 130 TaxID=2591006 RepID=UPI0011810647|nr:hypothetical protein [Streptomyces sp. 130]TRV78537.1 hypothetical protein FKN01_12620 [Streptomyces sp. 130]